MADDSGSHSTKIRHFFSGSEGRERENLLMHIQLIRRCNLKMSFMQWNWNNWEIRELSSLCLSLLILPWWWFGNTNRKFGKNNSVAFYTVISIVELISQFIPAVYAMTLKSIDIGIKNQIKCNDGAKTRLFFVFCPFFFLFSFFFKLFHCKKEASFYYRVYRQAIGPQWGGQEDWLNGRTLELTVTNTVTGKKKSYFNSRDILLYRKKRGQRNQTFWPNYVLTEPNRGKGKDKARETFLKMWSHKRARFCKGFSYVYKLSYVKKPSISVEKPFDEDTSVGKCVSMSECKYVSTQIRMEVR